jgi:hypothetical protein
VSIHEMNEEGQFLMICSEKCGYAQVHSIPTVESGVCCKENKWSITSTITNNLSKETSKHFHQSSSQEVKPQVTTLHHCITH